MTKIVINADYGGFGLSDAAEARYHDLSGKSLSWSTARDCPHLVQLVQELGSKANDEISVLKVVEIPNEIEWQIEEYDGMEWVSEIHKTWR